MYAGSCWFGLFAVCLALANVLVQYILGRSRTNLVHDLTSRILSANRAYPDLLSKPELHTFIVKDMNSVRILHANMHVSLERFCVCLACWIILMERSTELGLLALAIIFVSILVTSASDLFASGRNKGKMSKNIQASDMDAAMKVKDEDGKLTSATSMLGMLSFITKEEKFEQNMHMIVGGAMRLLVYAGPVLFFFVAISSARACKTNPRISKNQNHLK